MKITESIWFISLGLIGCVGIVMGEDEATGQRKAFVGVGYGVNEAFRRSCESIMAEWERLSNRYSF